jgi:hypothetical protein
MSVTIHFSQIRIQFICFQLLQHQLNGVQHIASLGDRYQTIDGVTIPGVMGGDDLIRNSPNYRYDINANWDD